MKKSLYFLAFSAAAVFAQAQTITQSNNTTVITPGSISCGNQAEGYTSFNQISRAFKMADFNLTKTWTIKEVAFAVESITGTLPFTVRVSKVSTGTYPTGAITELGSQDFEINETQAGKVVTYKFDNPITVEPGTTFVVSYEADGEEEYVSWYPGANDLGQKGQSYLKAPACGLATPGTFASVGYGSVHIVMTVTGEDALGLSETIGDSQFAVYPNPVVDMVSVKTPAGVEMNSAEVFDITGRKVAQFNEASTNLSNLKAGVYIIKVHTKDGQTLTQKLVKK